MHELFSQNNIAKLIVTDDETRLFKPLTGKDVLDYSAVHHFHRVTHEYLKKVVAAPTELLIDPQDIRTIADAFITNGWYGWFSDIPIYERDALEGFFERFGLTRRENFSRLTFESFDYIMYQYHLFVSGHEDRFNFMEWVPPSRIQASWFEMGYSTAQGREILAKYISENDPLRVSHSKLARLSPRTVAIYNLDRNYFNQFGPRKGIRDLVVRVRTFVGRMLSR